MRPRLKGALLLVLAFLLGGTTGALGLGLLQARTGWGRPDRDRGRIQQVLLTRLTGELDLRPDQQEKVEAILRESGQEFARLREEIRPRFQEIRRRTRDRIRGILDPEQQGRFEALADRWERQWAGRRGRHGEVPGGEKSRAP